MRKLLLTTVCRPIGPAQGDAPSVGYELLYGQITRAQGVFSPRATHVQFSLEYIAHNVDAPCTVLQYPSQRQLLRELRKGYDYIGIAFIMATFHHMKKIVALVRKHSPRTRIILGGYGTILSDEELKPYGDHVCREEGVAFMRRLLGEPPREMPYDHPTVISRLKVFSLPVSKTGMVFAGLGCANGCDFCCTSHFFKRRHIRLLPTGKDIYDVLCRYEDEKGISQFTILDEDFLLNKKRAEEFRQCVLKGRRTFSIFAFASIRALSHYDLDELVEMGIDGLWIGYEGTRSGYAKQQGRQPPELFPELTRRGILVLASMIVGFDYQDREVVAEELRGLLRLRPALTQFLIYGPTPGTPFYDRVVKEGRMRPEVFSDREEYYRHCTGFTSMVTHPRISAAEIEDIQRWCFEQDFQRLGPSMFRSIRVWLSGYQNLRGSPSEALRRKSWRLSEEARRAYPLFLAGRLLAPNPRIRRWLAAFERRLHRELGSPTLLERGLSVAAVAAALWTRLTLCFDWFQHPRLAARRFRWNDLKFFRLPLLGEAAEGETAPELSVALQRRPAEGWTCLRLKGILDGKNAEEFCRRMRGLLDYGKERIVIDLKGLGSINQEALAVLYRNFNDLRGRISLVLPDSPLAYAADLRRLADYFASAPGAQSPAWLFRCITTF